MGCCVSTKRAPSSLPKDSRFPQTPTIRTRRAPASAEEEAVKEVLSVSQTPKPESLVPSFEPKPQLTKIDEHNVSYEKILEKQSIFDPTELTSPTTTDKTTAVYDSASEDMSEVCSLSLSLSESVSTATINEKREEEVRPRVFRSPARTTPMNRGSVPNRDRIVGRSPNRRPDQSLIKRSGFVNGGSVRIVQSRDPGPTPRTDAGEISGRRSRSPGTNRSVIGRSPSVRRTKNSPGRVRAEQGESGKINKVKAEREDVGNASESLENPLVSLECFIFL